MHLEIKENQKKQAPTTDCRILVFWVGGVRPVPQWGNPRGCLSPLSLPLPPGLQGPSSPTMKLSSPGAGLGGGEGPEITAVAIPAFLGWMGTLPLSSKGSSRLPAHQWALM